jgi:mannosyltransferase OCH1-like enzyme
MKIPKVIHQTWRDENVPSHFHAFAESWKYHHPDWNYILWTDEMNRDFVSTNYPAFLKMYDDFPTNIQRADSIRYLLLEKFGGLYVDLDFECLQNTESLFKDFSCILGKEPRAHCVMHSRDMVICNAFMAAEPGSVFIAEVINNLLHNQISVTPNMNIVLETTGPFMLNRVYERFKRKEEVALLESNLIYPLNSRETIRLFNENNLERKNELRNNGAYALHYFWGTWWRKQSPFRQIN